MHLYWLGNEARFILQAEFCVKREKINQSTDDLFSVIQLCRHKLWKGVSDTFIGGFHKELLWAETRNFPSY